MSNRGNLELALESLANGKPVLIYDAEGREEETDIVVASEFVSHGIIRIMRKDGGGLICTTLPSDIADIIGLPFLVDVYEQSRERFPLLERALPDHLPYDTKSAFSLTINHKNNYTGITDRDRAATASEFGKLVAAIHNNGFDSDGALDYFCDNFRIPGHLHILRAAGGLLSNRQGHTELSTAMCIMAGTSPSATICEMMGDDGNALGRESAMKHAQEHGFVYLDGAEIIKEWNKWSE